MNVTLFGVLAVGFMIVMYALEKRGRIYLLGFSIGCLLSSTYGFLSGSWPFGIAEGIWFFVAFRRWRQA